VPASNGLLGIVGGALSMDISWPRLAISRGSVDDLSKLMEGGLVRRIHKRQSQEF